MEVSRRAALAGGLGVAGASAGAVAGAFGEAAYADSRSLPMYGGVSSLLPPEATQPVAASARLVWHASITSKALALTFDDGPVPGVTTRITAILKQAGVPATFFLLGSNTLRHGQLHDASVGIHELACHAFTHQDLARMSFAPAQNAIGRCAQVIQEHYGKRPTLFRPPYGHAGGSAMVAAASLGLTTVLWSAQFREASFPADPTGLTRDVISLVHPGAILLGHDNGRTDREVGIRALPMVLERLQHDGWTFHTVSGLLALEQREATFQQTARASGS